MLLESESCSYVGKICVFGAEGLKGLASHLSSLLPLQLGPESWHAYAHVCACHGIHTEVKKTTSSVSHCLSPCLRQGPFVICHCICHANWLVTSQGLSHFCLLTFCRSIRITVVRGRNLLYTGFGHQDHRCAQSHPASCRFWSPDHWPLHSHGKSFTS